MFHISRLPIPKKLKAYSLFMFLWCGAVVLSCTLLKTFLPSKLNLTGLQLSTCCIMGKIKTLLRWLSDLRGVLAGSKPTVHTNPVTPEAPLCNRYCSDAVVSRGTTCKHKHACMAWEGKELLVAVESLQALSHGPHPCCGRRRSLSG